MNSIRFVATLNSDVIISERPGSAGGHACLDHIPGACFLGACAATVYRDLGDQAFAVFHSGQVRFGNAYPLDLDGSESLPIPLSWHHLKGSEWHRDGRLCGGNIHNLLQVGERRHDVWEQDGVQVKQLRAGFFTRSGGLVEPRTEYRMKTAIDREQMNRSAESQLFGYESLAAGSRWYFEVGFDPGLPAELVERIAWALTRHPLRIGRSRCAEYGAVTVFREAGKAAETVPMCSDGAIHLYCLSDLALTSPETGAPILRPEPEAFGLAGASLLPERSFIRSRTYAPFNGKRRLNDLERTVICKGSVISFSRPAGVDLAALQLALSQGIGSYRYDGLGRVLMNPDFLMGEQFFAVVEPQTPKGAGTAVPAPAPPLGAWLQERVQERERTMRLKEQVEDWLKKIKLVERAPANSQWSQLRQIALQGGNRVEYLEMLFGEKGLCSHGVGKRQWEEEFRFGADWLSYRDFLEQKVICCRDFSDADLQQLLWLLGNRVPRLRNQGGKEVRP